MICISAAVLYIFDVSLDFWLAREWEENSKQTVPEPPNRCYG